jgi:hypothetical protein
MIIAGLYSFNGGREIIEANFVTELQEVEQIITAVDSERYKTKTSREKTMPGKNLYSPRALNKAFKTEFERRSWRNYRVRCDYPTQYYVPNYTPSTTSAGAFRDIDFVKNRVGVVRPKSWTGMKVNYHV